MASSRVQFALERTLPDITSEAYTAIFSPQELRSITHTRTRREASLHRRGLTEDDVQAYAAYEVQLEHLRRLRQSRGERDGSIAPLEPALKASTRRAYLSRVISIYERGLKRRPEHLSTWRAYMRWAASERMRVVLGRVMSRALGLHNQVPALWIECAQYEASNGEANKARALLQRGIAICKLPTSLSGKYANGIETGQHRPSKKVKLLSGSRSIISSASSTSRSSDVLISDRELSLLSLWIEYLRFELIFLEKLRRRWEVLGLSVTGQGATAGSSNGVGSKSAEEIIKEVEEEGKEDAAEEQGEEDAVASAVPAGGEDTAAATGVANGSTSSDSGLAPLLNGAIPLSILKSSLPSLPPTSHILFLLSALSLLHSFPFIRSSHNPSPRSGLVGEVLELLKTGETGRKLRHISATILATEGVMQLHEREVLGLDEDDAADDEEEDANADELESSEALKDIGNMRHPSIPDRLLDSARALLIPGSGTTKVEALDFVQHRLALALRDLVDDSPYADGRPLDLPSVVRDVVTRMREEVSWALQEGGATEEQRRDLYRAELGLVVMLRDVVGSLSKRNEDGEEDEDAAPSRATHALQAYLSAIARQRVSLARKDGTLDGSLEGIALRLALEELTSQPTSEADDELKTKLLKLHKRSNEVLRLLKSTPSHDDVVDLLLLGMKAFEAAHQGEGGKEDEAIDSEWERTLKHPSLSSLGGGSVTGKMSDHVQLWSAYTASLIVRHGRLSASSRKLEEKLQDALQRTRSSPLSHQAVLEAYLDAPVGQDSDEGARERHVSSRLSFVNRHALPGTALLRSLLARPWASPALRQSVYAQLLSRPDAEPRDAFEYAKLLMDQGDSRLALRVVGGKEAVGGKRDEEWVGEVQRLWQAWLEESERGEEE